MMIERSDVFPKIFTWPSSTNTIVASKHSSLVLIIIIIIIICYFLSVLLFLYKHFNLKYQNTQVC